MTEREKEILRCKYGHSKLLLALHMLGREIKNIYHPSTPPKRLTVCGKNNIMPCVPHGCSIDVYGDNNRIEIDPSIELWLGGVRIGDSNTHVNGCIVRIGRGCTSNGTAIILCEDNSKVSIGNNCMFSWGINLWASDTHTVYSEGTKEVLNWGKELIIEDHVWIGMQATVLKNSLISKNSIVGASSVVTKKFKQPNCVIAGNPAKIVKSGINWTPTRPKEYKNP